MSDDDYTVKVTRVTPDELQAIAAEKREEAKQCRVSARAATSTCTMPQAFGTCATWPRLLDGPRSHGGRDLSQRRVADAREALALTHPNAAK